MTRRILAIMTLGLVLIVPGCALNLFQGMDVGVHVENYSADPLTVTIRRDSCASGAIVAEITVPGVSSGNSQGVEFEFDATEPWSVCVNGVLRFESSEYDPGLAPYMNVRGTEDGTVLVEQGSYL